MLRRLRRRSGLVAPRRCLRPTEADVVGGPLPAAVEAGPESRFHEIDDLRPRFGGQPVEQAAGEGVEPEAEDVFASVQGRRPPPLRSRGTRASTCTRRSSGNRRRHGREVPRDGRYDRHSRLRRRPGHDDAPGHQGERLPPDRLTLLPSPDSLPHRAHQITAPGELRFSAARGSGTGQQGGKAPDQCRRHLANGPSARRLVGPVLAEEHDKWAVGYRCLTPVPRVLRSPGAPSYSMNVSIRSRAAVGTPAEYPVI